MKCRENKTLEIETLEKEGNKSCGSNSSCVIHYSLCIICLHDLHMGHHKKSERASEAKGSLVKSSEKLGEVRREVMAKLLEWISGQATWSGGQDVGVVPKGLEWWPRVLLGDQGSNF
ncbi:hypothetical protein Tco_1578580 [Tanacetum coccineum]